LKLEVEPTIFLENDVGIRVGLEVSNIAREIRSTTGTTTYQVGTRNASTTLRLKDGETQVLAGLISDEDRRSAAKVPGLGDLPVIGRLFGSTRDTVNKTEIVLLITPRVVRNLVRPDLRLEEFSSGTEGAVGADALTLPATPATAGVTAPAAPIPGMTPAPAVPGALPPAAPPPAVVPVPPPGVSPPIPPPPTGRPGAAVTPSGPGMTLIPAAHLSTTR
jgi:general secretion pathway protein D